MCYSGHVFPVGYYLLRTTNSSLYKLGMVDLLKRTTLLTLASQTCVLPSTSPTRPAITVANGPLHLAAVGGVKVIFLHHISKMGGTTLCSLAHANGECTDGGCKRFCCPACLHMRQELNLPCGACLLTALGNNLNCCCTVLAYMFPCRVSMPLTHPTTVAWWP